MKRRYGSTIEFEKKLVQRRWKQVALLLMNFTTTILLASLN